MAQRFSNIRIPADEPGLMTEAASAKSLSSTSPDETPSNMAKSNRPSRLMSASSNARTEPSRSFVMNLRSSIRMTPLSTRSTRMGKPSPAQATTASGSARTAGRPHVVKTIRTTPHWAR